MWFFLLVLALGVAGFIWASRENTDFSDEATDEDVNEGLVVDPARTDKTQSL